MLLLWNMGPVTHSQFGCMSAVKQEVTSSNHKIKKFTSAKILDMTKIPKDNLSAVTQENKLYVFTTVKWKQWENDDSFLFI